MLKASVAVVLLFVAAMAVPSAAANAENAKNCYQVVCTGTTGVCISLSVDPCGDVAAPSLVSPVSRPNTVSTLTRAR